MTITASTLLSTCLANRWLDLPWRWPHHKGLGTNRCNLTYRRPDRLWTTATVSRMRVPREMLTRTPLKTLWSTWSCAPGIESKFSTELGATGGAPSPAESTRVTNGSFETTPAELEQKTSPTFGRHHVQGRPCRRRTPATVSIGRSSANLVTSGAPVSSERLFGIPNGS